MQQVLATPHSPHLARFLPDPSVAERVRKTFAAIYPLDDSPAGKDAKALATDAERAVGYVLKPQREGGGNNIYRGAIPPFLRSLGDERKWRGFILMELIEPPALRNAIVREGVVKKGEVIGELGVYGACLWRGWVGGLGGKEGEKGVGGTGGEGGEGAEQGVGVEEGDKRVKDGGGNGGKGGVILHNKEAGYLLRTKGRESEEGGVAAGFGAVDSVCLVDV